VPASPDQKEARLQEIRRVLAQAPVRSQRELVRALRAAGFSVTQSSVSRDLRELGAVKAGGSYRVPAADPAPEASEVIAGAVRRVARAGPHLLVVQTEIGGASRVGLALDQAGWPQIVGTVAGDDTVFVAVNRRADQNALMARLARLVGREVIHD